MMPRLVKPRVVGTWHEWSSCPRDILPVAVTIVFCLFAAVVVVHHNVIYNIVVPNNRRHGLRGARDLLLPT